MTAETDPNALDRLGPPEQIVRIAMEQSDLARQATRPGPATAPTLNAAGVRARELITICTLVFGVPLAALVLPFIPPLIPIAMVAAFVTGLALLWTSRVWTAGEKLFATLAWPGGVGLPLLLGTMTTQVCTTAEVAGRVARLNDTPDPAAAVAACEGFSLSPAVGFPLLLALIAAPIIVGAVLLVRAQRRAGTVYAAGDPSPVPSAGWAVTESSHAPSASTTAGPR